MLLDSISGQEELGRLFNYELDLVTDDPALDFDRILGENVTVRIQLSEDKARYINGYVARFASGGLKRGLRAYTATVVPWTWFLTRTSNFRIFQNIKVEDVIKQIFEIHGFADFKLNLHESYRTWEYLVQYRETDFNFISRLMEQEGIYYYFIHENGKHTIVLADSSSSHDPLEGDPIPFFPPQEAEASRGPHVWGWEVERLVQPGAVSLTDYNFQKPSSSLLVRSVQARKHAASTFEMFDYPGEYPEFSDGERYAALRVDEHHSRFETIHAEGNVRGMTCGCKFKITDEQSYLNPADTKREYLLVSMSLSVTEPEDFGGGGGDEAFSISMLSIPAEQAFRAARTTPKPIVQGLQTAIVVGPAGEEIYTDELGRVKVHFYWDRHGKADENASCWVRVAQTISGKQWGSLYTPRIGHEVIVEFLEGDPDRPLVTGSVYNASNKPPYVPKEMATVSTFKSNSSKGGGGFNELRFEDKKGEEQIFVHGEKNLDIRIKNDAFELIGNDRHLVVKKDQIEHVENNREELVDKDHKEKIGKDRHLKVIGKEAKEVGKSLSLTVKDDVAEVFKKNQSTEVTKDLYIKATNICIEATTNITIKVGQSHIAIEASGIKIGTKGDFKIESTGPAEVKATAPLTLESSAKADLKSPASTVAGDAMLTLKGGLVKIN